MMIPKRFLPLVVILALATPAAGFQQQLISFDLPDQEGQAQGGSAATVLLDAFRYTCPAVFTPICQCPFLAPCETEMAPIALTTDSFTSIVVLISNAQDGDTWTWLWRAPVNNFGPTTVQFFDEYEGESNCFVASVPSGDQIILCGSTSLHAEVASFVPESLPGLWHIEVAYNAEEIICVPFELFAPPSLSISDVVPDQLSTGVLQVDVELQVSPQGVGPWTTTLRLAVDDEPLSNGIDLSRKLDDPSLDRTAGRALRKELAALRDPSPGKSGIVRDRALRDRLRKRIRCAGFDPDKFSTHDIKTLAVAGKLTMASGVPIKGIVLLRTNTDPIIIPRKRDDPLTGRRERVVDSRDEGEDVQRTDRVYVGGNNHHIEIRADGKTGKWRGKIVRMFDAARRVRIEKMDAVDRTDRGDAVFVMSLSEGEMVYARRAD